MKISEHMAIALRDVAAERERQVKKERWSRRHDDGHTTGELACAAAAYAYGASLSQEEKEFHRDALYGSRRGISSIIARLWPWDSRWYKPKDRRSDLIRAAALLVAEIERIDRAPSKMAG